MQTPSSYNLSNQKYNGPAPFGGVESVIGFE